MVVWLGAADVASGGWAIGCWECVSIFGNDF